LHYLAAVAVSAYLRGNHGSVPSDSRVLKVLLAENWTSGLVLGLCREALAGLRAVGLAPYSELVEFFFEPDDTGKSGHERLDQLVAIRNDIVHRGAPRIEEMQDGLEQVLARMPWLARDRLLRPLEIDDNVVRKVELLHGEVPTTDNRISFG